MPRPMDLLGKYVVWPNAAQISVGTVAPAHGPMIAKTESTPLSLMVYSTGGGAPLAFSGGIHLVPDTTPWGFTFLKYQDGGVTEERLGNPILTGAMSGCYTFS